MNISSVEILTMTNVVTPTPSTSEAAVSSQINRNDNSNPQQGTGGPVGQQVKEMPRANMLVPPTKKDSRKLFVGGLPADSK